MDRPTAPPQPVTSSESPCEFDTRKGVRFLAWFLGGASAVICACFAVGIICVDPWDVARRELPLLAFLPSVLGVIHLIAWLRDGRLRYLIDSHAVQVLSGTAVRRAIRRDQVKGCSGTHGRMELTLSSGKRLTFHYLWESQRFVDCLQRRGYPAGVN